MHIAPIAVSVGDSSALPPLQDRSPEQLRDGMIVAVKGAGSDDLAVARLIQDGAQFMARIADTTMGLATVEINYKDADRQGALGLATFQGTKGWFALSVRSTSGLLEGISRLRSTPWLQWSERDRQAFVQANETILHEAAHVTLSGYARDDVDAWRKADRSIEEGISEVATMTNVASFMRDEFGIDLGALSNRISQSTSAYTRYSERLQRLLGMGTVDGSSAAIAAAAAFVSDGVHADLRTQEIARRMGLALGGGDAPAQIIEEIKKTIPGFIAEQNGTRTKLMELQAALVDHKAGRQIADVEAFIERLRDKYDAGKTPTFGPVVGEAPIACGENF